ncbi:MAG: alanyl-tRNA editing protein [Woeseiaceae bacterium]|nr:alanyl-tRNA editing protein [Woeseiaceae bacterium]
MATDELFRSDAYLRTCSAVVTRVDDHRVWFDRTVFYPCGGGQPGDTGRILWAGGHVDVVDTLNDDGDIAHVVSDGALPSPGTAVELEIDWDRRYRHMRMHTALHLLGAVLQYPVTGGNISSDKSRLDFNMEDTIDKDTLAADVNRLVTEDHPVSHRWISDAELDAQPELVRTMSVQPPRGKGRVRLLDVDGVDLQPCGGTHVRRTGEIGTIRIGKVEKKGRQNRRVNIHLDN